MAVLARLLAAVLAALTLSAPAGAVRLPHHPRVASGVRSISIRSDAGVSVRVTRASTVETIVRWFNALGPFRARPCPLLAREPATVTFEFAAPGFARTTAVDRDPGACDGAISYGNGLQVRYPALADDHFVARVSRLLGIDLEAPQTTAANREAAPNAATKLLGLVVLPAGARRLAAAPGDAAGQLGRPWFKPSYTKLVDRHGFWRVDSSVDSVAAFLRAHPPRGSHYDSGQLSPPPRTLLFDLPATRRFYQRQVSMTVAALPDGRAGVRVDALVVWKVERSPREVVPTSVREIDIATPAQTDRITNAAKVKTIVRWFDALPVAQPSRGIYACPLVVGPYVRITFRGAGSAVLARASVEYDRGDSYFCNAIQFSIGGRRKAPLLGGHFLRRVERLAKLHLG